MALDGGKKHTDIKHIMNNQKKFEYYLQYLKKMRNYTEEFRNVKKCICICALGEKMPTFEKQTLCLKNKKQTLL